jgi:hypothetical protein
MLLQKVVARSTGEGARVGVVGVILMGSVEASVEF